ncbi:MAG: hypothetical protein AAF433_20610 [Bacteroidota bacterium]
MKTLFSSLSLVLLLLACDNSPEQELASRFRQLEATIAEGDLDGLMVMLDRRSLQYVNFISDTSNLTYDKAISFTSPMSLELFSALYAHRTRPLLVGDDSPHAAVPFFNYLGYSQVPLFRLNNPAVLDPDRIEATEKEGYVTLKNYLLEDAVISSRVPFYREGDHFQLDLIALLQFEERLLRQQFEQYKNVTPRTNLEALYPGNPRMQTDLQYRFIQEQHLKDYELQEVQLRGG